MEYLEAIKSNWREIIRFEECRQMYLEKGMNPDWVHARIDGFIDQENKRLSKRLIMLRYERQQQRIK
jgi:hypothetical protein